MLRTDIKTLQIYIQLIRIASHSIHSLKIKIVYKLMVEKIGHALTAKSNINARKTLVLEMVSILLCVVYYIDINLRMDFQTKQNLLGNEILIAASTDDVSVKTATIEHTCWSLSSGQLST